MRYSLINLFIQDVYVARLQVRYFSEALPTQHDTVSEFHAEAPQASASEGLSQGSYVEARAGVDPTTPRTIGVDPTNEPPRPTLSYNTAVQSIKVYVKQVYNFYV